MKCLHICKSIWILFCPIGLFILVPVVVVQSLICVQLFVTPWTAECQASLSFATSQSLLKHIHWVADAIQSSCPLSPLSPPAFNLSQHQGLFRWVSSSHHMAKVLELQLQSFQRIFRVDFLYDWLVWSPSCTRDSQESSLEHSSKASVLWCSAFFIVQFSHSYMTPGKTTALTRQTFVGKVMSLLFNMLSTFVRVFLLRSKYLLISWLQHCPQWFWSPRK